MRFLGVWFVMLVLAGCANLAPPPVRPAVETLTAFTFSGRISIRQGEQRHHARIDWQHVSERDSIVLATPLGQGIAELMRDPSGAQLVLADKRRFIAADWGDLSAEIFGMRLPLGNATRWLLGDLRETAGWNVRIVERESDQTNALPSVIELERDDIAVRLKIDEWIDVQ